ncbi:MAG TPA: ribosome biogenesis factor YjgA [Steroidobacter sp.]|uniref:ribosome biogenesis factor YjgA n=1 Tax=Steroidobacter sp. TaxID=1978227 RepID=UPI002ED8A367
MTDDADDGYQDERPSKSERKRRSDDLQALGEALIELSDSELDALPLPEQLRDAVDLARRITAHGGLYRQKQYIGKLMRKIDAEPIRAALDAKRDRERVEALRFHRVEQWRDRLLSEGAAALAQLLAEVPGIDGAALGKLTERARKEQRQSGQKITAAGRELFRMLRAALTQEDRAQQEQSGEAPPT